ncbi:hypothetical protein NDU88_004874 [Pleurodeles waltl]|uniref:Uncharacterized protein n=1 Tax=Pleurodeles waltl TaxID=8319 RepID=A0AAV7V492_PLEWA|nr:hypothetical protein NDU88_004874 [Pleurodeles waltl]
MRVPRSSALVLPVTSLPAWPGRGARTWTSADCPVQKCPTTHWQREPGLGAGPAPPKTGHKARAGAWARALLLQRLDTKREPGPGRGPCSSKDWTQSESQGLGACPAPPNTGHKVRAGARARALLLQRLDTKREPGPGRGPCSSKHWTQSESRGLGAGPCSIKDWHQVRAGTWARGPAPPKTDTKREPEPGCGALLHQRLTQSGSLSLGAGPCSSKDWTQSESRDLGAGPCSSKTDTKREPEPGCGALIHQRLTQSDSLSLGARPCSIKD